MKTTQHTLPFTLVFETSEGTLESFKHKRGVLRDILRQVTNGNSWGNYLDSLMEEYSYESEKLPFDKFKEIVQKIDEDDIDDGCICQNISVDYCLTKGKDGEKIIDGTVTWETDYPVAHMMYEDAGEGLEEKFTLWFLDLEEIADDLIPIWSFGDATSKLVK